MKTTAAIAWVACVCFAGTLSVARAEPPRTITIPAGELSAALESLVEQTGIQLLYDLKQVEGMHTEGVSGASSPQAAVTALLKGTSLTVRTDSSGAILITASASSLSTDASVSTETLEEVVVTAQKRSERLKDVPVSVSVLSSKRMLESHQTSLIDYAATIAGLQVDGGSPGQSRLTLRGLALGGAAATVGTYIDDVPYGSSSGAQAARGLALDLLPYDLERIEVLRGPQGTFYGANALGGLLKYVTKAPDLREYQLSTGTDLLSVADGSDLGYTVRVGGNAPLLDDTLAIRASYARDVAPGYLDTPTLHRRDVNETTRQTANLALLWRVSDRLSLKLSGLVEEIDSADSAQVRLDLATRQPVLGDLQGVGALAQPFKRTMQLYGVTLKYDLGWSELTSASSFASSKTELRQDLTEDYGPLVTLLTEGAVAAPLVPFAVKFDLEKYTQEFRLATPAGARWEGMLGAFFTYEDAPGNLQRVDALDAGGAPIAGLSPLLLANIPTVYREGAVFGNVTGKLTERFDVSAGMRYARNRQKTQTIVSGALMLADDTISRSSESVFNYSVAPRIRFNDDLMAYLRVATGYRPGGPNVPSLNPDVPAQYRADRITNYEVGLKSSLLDRRAELNLAAFQIDWSDVQIELIDASTSANYSSNGKTARSRGVELESMYRPISGLSLGLTATYIDAVLTADLPANSTLIGASGDRLPLAPRFSGAVTVNYTVPLARNWDGALGATYQYVGSRYSGLSGDALSLLLDEYSTVDLNVGAANASWSVNLFVRNLTDKRTYVTENLVADPFTLQPAAIDGTVIRPRTIGLSVDKRF